MARTTAAAQPKMHPKQAEQLMKRYAVLMEQYGPIWDEMEDIENQFREMGIGVHENRYGKAVVSRNSRVDLDAVISRLSPRSLARVMVTTIDTNLVKELFPRVYRECRKEFAPRIRIEARRTLRAVK